jgi:hypothetical protein
MTPDGTAGATNRCVKLVEKLGYLRKLIDDRSSDRGSGPLGRCDWRLLLTKHAEHGRQPDSHRIRGSLPL